MLIRKALCALLVAAMLLTVLMSGASAEAAVDLSSAMPIIDLTVSSSVRVGEYPESVSEDGYVSTAFTQNLFRDGVNADVGITADMATDTEKQADYMSKVFIPQAAGLAPVEDTNIPDGYIGLYVFSQTYDEATGIGTVIGNVYQAPAALSELSNDQFGDVKWMDLRMQVKVAVDAASPAGWRILSFNWDNPDIIDAVQEHINDTMLEYVNSEYGYTIQYPAVFDDSVAFETETGLSGTLADGTASFSVERTANQDGKTAAELGQAIADAHEGSTVTVNDITGTCRVDWKGSDGSTVMDLIIVSGDNVLKAELIYTSSLAPQFSLYSEYMMNSFTADQNGIG